MLIYSIAVAGHGQFTKGKVPRFKKIKRNLTEINQPQTNHTQTLGSTRAGELRSKKIVPVQGRYIDGIPLPTIGVVVGMNSPGFSGGLIRGRGRGWCHRETWKPRRL